MTGSLVPAAWMYADVAATNVGPVIRNPVLTGRARVVRQGAGVMLGKVQVPLRISARGR